MAPALPDEAYFALAPDWICEILSKSTAEIDRDEKMPIYAREGVQLAWLVDPIEKTLEACKLDPRSQWVHLGTHHGAARARVEPFDILELDLSVLWAK